MKQNAKYGTRRGGETRNFGMKSRSSMLCIYSDNDTPILARTWQIDCTRRLRQRVGERIFECSRRLEATATSSSMRSMVASREPVPRPTSMKLNSVRSGTSVVRTAR